jgi:polysaccharide chain length determinant protein (PEP-CTERM system associated)
MDDLTAQLSALLKGIWKYRWVAVIATWVVAIVGAYIVYEMPDDYKASARIYVDTQNILKPLMTGASIAPNMDRQVTIMSRTLISRPNVERVVHMVGLDVGPDGKTKKSKEREGIVTGLMNPLPDGAGIKLDSTGGHNLFTISYNNPDKKIAKGVIQSLLSIFVEGSIESSDPTSALRFIDEQIKGYEEKLTTQENNLTAFKQKNIGLMPQQGTDYYSQLAIAAENLKKTELELREAERARDSIKQQITGDEPVLHMEITASSIVNVELDARIAELRRNLDTLSLNFTDQHPDIISTKRLIAQLQQRKIEEAMMMKSDSFDPGKNYSPMLQQLNLALTESEAKVASMRVRVDTYTDRYNHLKSLSNSVPEVEASLAQLNRDYEVNRVNYQKLLERREAIKLSSGAESSIDLMSFKIIDPPTVSEAPVGPDRGRLYSLAFLIALVVGIGIAFIISQLRPAFHSQNTLREITGIPVLGSIPMIWTVLEKSNRKKRLFVFGLSLLSLFGFYGVLMVKMT